MIMSSVNEDNFTSFFPNFMICMFIFLPYFNDKDLQFNIEQSGEIEYQNKLMIVKVL